MNKNNVSLLLNKEYTRFVVMENIIHALLIILENRKIFPHNGISTANTIAIS